MSNVRGALEQTLELDLPLVLPSAEDERDQCVERLLERLDGQRGVTRAHIEHKDGAEAATLCLHYDPATVPLSVVQRIAEEEGATVTKRYRHETLWITGMDCADCAASVEHVLGRTPGLLNISVSYAAERLRLEYDARQTSHPALVARVRAMGYNVEERKEATWFQEHWELTLSVLAGLLLLVGFVGEQIFHLPQGVAIALYLMAYVSGGFDAARHGVAAALRGRFEIDFLMVVAAIGAAILGDWAEGALLLFLFSLGHALEHLAMDRARHAIDALGQIAPKSARVRRDGVERDIPVEEALRGDIVILRAGERIPIDGQVVAGASAVDQSPITGESVPVEKRTGDGVFAGSVNGEGALEIEVTKLAQDTTLARVIQLVAEAQTQKSPTQRLTERFERIFVPVVLVSVTLVMIVPPLLGWLSWTTAILRGLTMLVAASPCALALATPATILAAIAQAARHGVLIKGGVYLEQLGSLRAIAFDKTGTLTRGEPSVTEIIPLEDGSERELLEYAAAIESRSSHPLARAVIRAAHERGIAPSDVGNVEQAQTIPGRGVRAVIGRQIVRIGSISLFTEDGAGTGQDAGQVAVPPTAPSSRSASDGRCDRKVVSVPADVVARAHALEAAGQTTMLVGLDSRLLGIICVADQARPQAGAALTQLRAMGVRALIMLTGDNPRVAAAIAREVGLTDYRAELLPEEKVQAITQLRETYGTIAMVGDGVNDAPAMAQATVGIAMGASGTDVALETADVALMADDLAKLPFAVALGQQARRVIRQNLIISLGVIALLLPSALLGLAGIGVAIIVHEGSTLLVVANALRLLRFAGAQPSAPMFQTARSA